MKYPLASLAGLPLEIFEIICSFLKVSTIVHSLSLVCKKFNDIINNDSFWKALIRRMWPNTNYPILHPENPDRMFWKLSCIVIQKQKELWTQNEHPMNNIATDTYTQKYIANGGSLLLTHNGTAYIIGIDSRLTYRKLDPRRDSYSMNVGGLIFDLTIIDNTIYGSIADGSIKSWMITDNSVEVQNTYECNLRRLDWPLHLSSCQERALFATGSDIGNVFVFDSRSREQPITQYRPNEKDNILKLAMDSDYILSASYNNIISIWDQKAARIMKHVSIPGNVNCMKINQDCVYIGDTDAKLHILNPKKDFELVKSYSTRHRNTITGMHLTNENLITSSLDGSVIISSPTDPPKHMYTLTLPSQRIEGMDYQNDVLALFSSLNVQQSQYSCVRDDDFVSICHVKYHIRIYKTYVRFRKSAVHIRIPHYNNNIVLLSSNKKIVN